MSENPHLSQTENLPATLYAGWRKRFYRDLTATGFHRCQTEAGDEWWRGVLHVAWDDPNTNDYCSAEHCIQIQLSPAFPFEKPRVFPCDTDPPIRDSRHQSPGSDQGALCLWSDNGFGWNPSMTADEVLARIRQWFDHYHRDDWSTEDRPPDLHLYFPATFPHPFMLIGDDWAPPPDVQTGRFGVWQKDATRPFAGAPQSGVTMPPPTHTDRILSTIGIDQQRRDPVGLWFRLQREPCPRHTLDALLNEIDDAAHQPGDWALTQMRAVFGDKVQQPKDVAIFALGYPDDTKKEQWLFLRCKLGSDAKVTKWRQPGMLQRIPIESFAVAEVGQQALMRRTGHVAQHIEGRCVLIFGQGAIGSTMTVLLAKAGLQHLRIVDSDTLRPGNAVRHVGDLWAIGYKKTIITQVATTHHVPDCEIDCENATWKPDVLTSWIQAADVVIDATANQPFSLLINQLCVAAQRPAVYVTSHRRATVGRIRLVRPGRDACLVCYEGGYRETAAYPIIPVGDEGAFMESGCGIPSVEASAVDIDQVANWGARIALWVLQDKLDTPCHLLIINDPVPDMPEPLTMPGVYWSAWKPFPHCTACEELHT